MKIQIKKLRPEARVPTQGTEKSAGYDVYACIDNPLKINPHKTVLVPTGLAIKPPEGYYVAIVARSGLACKQGLRLANCYAVCDEDYRGEYMIPLHNDSDNARTIYPNDRIGQILLKKYFICEFEEVNELDPTERGMGGFGSTGF